MRLRTMPEKGKCLARRVLYPAEMLVLLFCTVRKPALARIVRKKLNTMGPRHLPHTNNCAAWVLTNTYPGGFRQTCIISELPESIGPNRPT